MQPAPKTRRFTLFGTVARLHDASQVNLTGNRHFHILKDGARLRSCHGIVAAMHDRLCADQHFMLDNRHMAQTQPISGKICWCFCASADTTPKKIMISMNSEFSFVNGCKCHKKAASRAQKLITSQHRLQIKQWCSPKPVACMICRGWTQIIQPWRSRRNQVISDIASSAVCIELRTSLKSLRTELRSFHSR